MRFTPVFYAALVVAAPLKRAVVYEVVTAPSSGASNGGSSSSPASAGSVASSPSTSSNVNVVYVDQNGNQIGTSASAAASGSAPSPSITYSQGGNSGSSSSSSSPVSSSAPSSPSSSPSSGGGSAPASGSFQDQMVSMTNNYRSQHGAGAVTWSSTLASYAANAAAGCKMQHTGGPYGENIYMTSASTSSASDAVTAWYNEVSQYHGQGFSEATGHYTQLVWKATTQIGCAMQTCSGGTYTFCEYQTAGNVAGEYAQNVS